MCRLKLAGGWRTADLGEAVQDQRQEVSKAIITAVMIPKDQSGHDLSW